MRLATLLRRVALLLLGTGGSALVSFATQSLLTRGMDVESYGHVAAMLATVNVLTPVAGLGAGWFLLELFGREGRQATRWMPAAQRLTLLASLASALALVAYVALGPTADGPHGWIFALLLVPVLLGQSLGETTAACLQIEERFPALAAWQMCPQLGRLLAVLPLFLLGAVATGSLLAGYAAVGLAMSAISLRFLARLRRGQVRLPAAPAQAGRAACPPVPGLREAFAAATPYSFVTVFYLVYSQGIVSMVAAMLGPRAAGLYNAAFLVTAVVYLVPNVIYMKLLAGKLLRWWTHDRAMFVSVFHLGVAAHLGMGLACALIVAAASPWLVPLLFGPRYGEAVAVLNILAVGIPVRFVQHSYGSALFAREHISRKIRLMGCAAGASVVLNLLLTPLLGLSGAAWAAVLSEALLLLLYMRAVACHVEGLEVGASLRVASLRSAWGCVMRRGGTPGAVPATADASCPP